MCFHSPPRIRHSKGSSRQKDPQPFAHKISALRESVNISYQLFLHRRGHEFRRPCLLSTFEESQEKSLRKRLLAAAVLKKDLTPCGSPGPTSNFIRSVTSYSRRKAWAVPSCSSRRASTVRPEFSWGSLSPLLQRLAVRHVVVVTSLPSSPQTS